MRATAVKRITTLIYGDFSRRVPADAMPWLRSQMKERRQMYQRAKKSYVKKACVVLILQMQQL